VNVTFYENGDPRSYPYKVLHGGFPQGHDANYTLTILEPADAENAPPGAISGMFQHWLKVASFDRDEKQWEYQPVTEILVGAWPVAEDFAVPYRTVPLTLAGDKIRPESPPYSSSDPRKYLQFKCESCKPPDGLSGSPIVDLSGTVWGVLVARNPGGHGFIAHWGYDIDYKYRERPANASQTPETRPSVADIRR
jgi:hypothetical protein